MMHTSIRICYFIVGILLFSACTHSPEQSAPAQDTPPPALRIVSCSGMLTELLVKLGYGQQIVGRDITSTTPADQLKDIPSIGHVSQMNAEAILELNPNLILVEKDQSKQTEVLAQLKNSGIQIIEVPTSTTLDNTVKVAKFIQPYLSSEVEKKAQALADQIKTDSLKLAGVLAKTDKKPKVLFIYARGAGRLLVGGKNTSAEAIIQHAGGQNAIQTFEDFKPLTSEALLQAAPEVILMFESGLSSLNGKSGVAKIPGMSQTPAFQQDRIITMDGHLLTAFGVRAAEAATLLAEQIHAL